MAARPRPRGRRRDEHVPERLRHLLAALQVPAFIEGHAFDVLASNPLAVALSPRLRPGENRLRLLLLDPEEHDFHTDWDSATAGFVAALRGSIGDDTDDERIVELVDELSQASERFRSLWARHDIGRLEGGTATINHPVLGPVRFNRDKLPVGDLILVVYYPDVDSDAAEKLGMLASSLNAAPSEQAQLSAPPTGMPSGGAAPSRQAEL